MPKSAWSYDKYIFIFIYLLERDKEHAHSGRGGRRRKRARESQADCMPSVEPDAGLGPTTPRS